MIEHFSVIKLAVKLSSLHTQCYVVSTFTIFICVKAFVCFRTAKFIASEHQFCSRICLIKLLKTLNHDTLKWDFCIYCAGDIRKCTTQNTRNTQLEPKVSGNYQSETWILRENPLLVPESFPEKQYFALCLTWYDL